MKALSIRQPWAWLILFGGKDIENRTWRTSFRGRILIHASKSCTKSEYYETAEFARSMNVFIPPLKELQRGGIVGSVEITDCVYQSKSPWFFGDYGFVLKNPQPLEFAPSKGRLGIFEAGSL